MTSRRRPPRSAARTGWRAWSCTATAAAASWGSRPPTSPARRYTALPADGVYAGRFVHRPAGACRAAVSVGTNPTFSGTVRTVEAYVLDVDEDFYGHEVGVDFVARLRGQERYDSVERAGRADRRTTWRGPGAARRV